ncbi:MAG: hypothetical protein Q8922_02140 [Bacteroidota bacterium]|nr:hypothetical protein [Bacteroidota bacterium]MDP4232326.1 hypothetical protein [Bacteroidota bacterium]MDP4241465.1 hypothetical protein [Bacteroidota bacterium]MDP4286711.1 hypothetical protein [Bacteroidota bacterium]
MIRENLAYAAFAFLLCFQIGCKSSTGPAATNTGGASGTFVFGEAIDEVATTTLGSNRSSVLFHGDDPSFIGNGKVLYSVLGSYTADQFEQIVSSSIDGTGATTLVDLGEWNSYVYLHPKMSPDGKYITFNYWSDVAQKFGTKFGTILFPTDGSQPLIMEDYWDAAWTPDGSLILSATLTPIGTQSTTYHGGGLFKLNSSFTSATQIGTGLTAPQYPAVSPDGKRIAFAMNSHIWTINMDGTGLKQITTGSNQETYSTWSPDGSSIACVTDGDIGLTGGNSLAIVSSNPTTPVIVSQDNSSVYVKDNTNSTTGTLNPQGNISWR